MGQRHPARRILVVDDNLDAAELVAELLALQGHHVVVACNGVDALAAAGRLDPDVVFLDIGMPDMDGYQVASAYANRSGVRRPASWPSPFGVMLRPEPKRG
jgi:CheY-like chemotaxis protein